MSTDGTRTTRLLVPRHWMDLISGGALVLVFLGVSLPRLRGPIDLRWDASTYYVLGTAVAEGRGYRLLNEPGEIQAVQYPPLLPSIVAAFERLMKTTDYFIIGSRLRVFYLILSFIYLLTVYGFARQMLRPMEALLVASIVALSFSGFIYPSEILYADLPFALASLAFLLCQAQNTRPPAAVAQGIFAVAAYFLRAAGIVLFVVWIIESLVQRRWNQSAIRACVAAIAVLAWQGYVWHTTHSDEYRRPGYSYQRAAYYYPNVSYAENSSLKDPFRPELGRADLVDLAVRVGRNLAAIPLELGESAWINTGLMHYPLAKLAAKFEKKTSAGWQGPVIAVVSIIATILGLLSLIGASLTIRRACWSVALYYALTIILTALTPWRSQFWRYLSPLVPVTLVLAVTALREIRSWVVARRLVRCRPARLLVPIILVGLILPQIGIAEPFLKNLLPVSYYDSTGREKVYPLLTYEAHWHALDRVFEWVRRNTEPATIIATTVPQLAYLRSGRKAVLPPFELSRERANRLLDEVSVSYAIVDELGRPAISDRYLAPLVVNDPHRWQLVYTAPDSHTSVYQRQH